MPCCEHADDRADADHAEDEQRHQRARRRRRQALRRFQVRHSPQQREHHHRELRAHVTEEPEPRTRPAPDVPQLTSHLPGGHRRRGRPSARRGIADHRGRQQGHERAARRGQAERRGPARVMQQHQEGHGRKDLAELAQDGRQLGDQRDASRRKPARDESENRDEHHGVPQPDQDPGQHGLGQGGGAGQHELAGGQENPADDKHDPRAKPIDEQASRSLGRDVDGDLDEHESRQHPRGDAESPGGVQPGDTERRPLHDGQDVGQDPGAPHGPRTSAPDRFPGRGHCSPSLYVTDSVWQILSIMANLPKFAMGR